MSAKQPSESIGHRAPRVRRPSVFAVVLLHACSSPALTTNADPRAKSLFLRVELDFESRWTAKSILEGPTYLDLPHEATSLTVFGSEWTLEALQVPEGLVELYSPSDGRRFPTPTSVDSADLTQATPSWRGDGDLDLLNELTLPPLDLLRCADSGGCLLTQQHAEIACSLPCPEPSPVAAPLLPNSPSEPASPADLRVTCPTDWTLEESGAARCQHPPIPAPVACAREEAQFFGETDCKPIGEPCPASGQFSTQLPTDRPTLFVRADAATLGDGSLSSPFQSVSEALSAAQPGTVVALGAGAYREDLTLTAPVRIVGRCVGDTTIVGDFVAGTDSELANLGVRGRLLVGEDQSLRVEGVLVESPGPGWITRYGRSSGREVVIRGGGTEAAIRLDAAESTLSRVVVEWGGIAVFLDEGSSASLRDVRVGDYDAKYAVAATDSHLDLSRAVIDRDRGITLAASTASISDVAIRGGANSDTGGHALEVWAGTRATAARMSIEETRGYQVFVAQAGTSLDLVDSIVARSRAENRSEGGGVRVAGAHLNLSRVELTGNEGPGLSLTASASARVSDSAIVSQRLGTDLLGGIVVEAGSKLLMTRSRVSDNPVAGLRVHGRSLAEVSDSSFNAQFGVDELEGTGVRADSGSVLVLGRARFSDNQAGSVLVSTATGTLADISAELVDGFLGAAVTAERGAIVDLHRARLDCGSSGAGVAAIGAGTELHAEDLIARSGANSSAPAVVARDHAHFVVTRVDCSGIGVLVDEGGRLELVDATVREANQSLFVSRAELALSRVLVRNAKLPAAQFERATISGQDLSLLDGASQGLHSWDGSVLTLGRVSIEGMARFGLSVSGGQADFTDLVVKDTAVDSKSVALRALEGSRSTVERFRLTESVVGIAISAPAPGTAPAEIVLRDGEISNTQTGTLVSNSQPLAPLLVRARYRENDRSFGQ
ncbi:MAG: DUF1565 domain-containing protein [Deltaproteobacteria bacterium]|nr:DUF1565 domain-containing protein [Deltaproteobacteria bacterium]